MEKYRKSLIDSCVKLAVLFIILIITFLIFGTPLVSQSMQRVEFSSKDMLSMTSGGVAGFTIAVICMITTWLRAIKNPQKLSAMYIKNNDERELLIQMKTGFSTYNISIYLLLIAAVISSRINSDICFTLFAVIAVMTLIYGASNVYYRKKF
jgi:hypothetical protein